MLKNPSKYEKIHLAGKIHDKFLLLRNEVSVLVTARELWRMNQMRRTVDQKWSQCMTRLVRYHPVKIRVAPSHRTLDYC